MPCFDWLCSLSHVNDQKFIWHQFKSEFCESEVIFFRSGQKPLLYNKPNFTNATNASSESERGRNYVGSTTSGEAPDHQVKVFESRDVSNWEKML